MNRIKLLSAAIMFFAAIGFTSCDTEPVDPVLLDNVNNPQVPTNPNNPNNPNNPSNPNNPGAGTFQVDFNGQTFVATEVQAGVTDGLMGIQGIRGTNGEAVSLVLPAEGVGTYTIDDEIFMNYSLSESQEYGYTNINFSNGQSSGTIVITEFDEVNHTISGTFNFTGWYDDSDAGMAPIQFTNGSFSDVPYTIGENGDDTFTATVNGTPFNTQNIIPAVSETPAGDPDFISINALDDDLNNITVSIKESVPVGTYPISTEPFSQARASYTTHDDDVTHTGTSGTLTVTSKANGIITGTFSFTTADGYTITNGTFSVLYDF